MKNMEEKPTFLPHFPYLFTIQLGILPYFPYLITIQLAFLPYFSYHFTIQLMFLKSEKIWEIQKKGKLNREKDMENTEEQ
jgi:hypothetical protein